jgi:hypothetical protein
MPQKSQKQDLIPTFVHGPKPSAEGIHRAMQAKAQYDLADSQDCSEDSLNVPTEDLFIDSLQRLEDVEDDQSGYSRQASIGR